MVFAVITVGNTVLPTPMPFYITSTDIDVTDTAQDGATWRRVVRYKKRSITVNWDNLTPAGLDTIQDTIAPTAFQLNIDYTTAGYFSFFAYAENFSFTIKRILNNGAAARFSVQVTFKEI
jgi:hypothetical protein